MKKTVLLALILKFVNIVYAQPQYVTSIHPFAEILKEVVGKRGKVIRTLPPGASPHTYDLKPSDLRAVQSATAVFYGSPHLDGWAVRFPIRAKIMFMDLVPESLRLKFPEGIQDPDHGLSESDPHFWTDVLTVKSILPALVDTLCHLDPDGGTVFRTNAQKFAARLDSLDKEIRQLLAPIRHRTVLLSHPFFRYFMNRYDFEIADYVEPLPGKEPTPKALQRLVRNIQQRKVRAIFTSPQDSQRPSQIVAEAAGIQVFILDPIGGVDGRKTYQEMIMTCAQVLLKALK